MHIYQASITKSVTKQVQQFEPVKVEVALHMQIDEDDEFDGCMDQLRDAVENQIAIAFGGEVPAGKVEVKENKKSAKKAPSKSAIVDEDDEDEAPKPKKRKRRTKAEMEAAKKAEAEEAEQTEDDGDEDDTSLDDIMGGSDEVSVDEPAEPLTMEQTMAAVNRAVKHLKPKGIKTLMQKNFDVDRVGDIQVEQRNDFVAAMEVGCADMGVELSLM